MLFFAMIPIFKNIYKHIHTQANETADVSQFSSVLCTKISSRVVRDTNIYTYIYTV